MALGEMALRMVGVTDEPSSKLSCKARARRTPAWVNTSRGNVSDANVVLETGFTFLASLKRVWFVIVGLPFLHLVGPLQDVLGFEYSFKLPMACSVIYVFRYSIFNLVE
jgi:hypothetical protein